MYVTGLITAYDYNRIRCKCICGIITVRAAQLSATPPKRSLDFIAVNNLNSFIKLQQKAA